MTAKEAYEQTIWNIISTSIRVEIKTAILDGKTEYYINPNELDENSINCLTYLGFAVKYIERIDKYKISWNMLIM